MKQQFSLLNVLKYAGAYAACAIGSGFATGQEIMQFFTAQGAMSILGAVVTMLIFGWAGGTVMKDSSDLGLENPGLIARFYFGEKIGFLFDQNCNNKLRTLLHATPWCYELLSSS